MPEAWEGPAIEVVGSFELRRRDVLLRAAEAGTATVVVNRRTGRILGAFVPADRVLTALGDIPAELLPPVVHRHRHGGTEHRLHVAEEAHA